MSTSADTRLDAFPEARCASTSPPARAGARWFDLPLGELDPMTRTRARLLAGDVLATMAPDAGCFVSAGSTHVRVEFEGRLDAGPGALHLVCRRADRWGLSLGDVRGDLIWFELDR